MWVDPDDGPRETDAEADDERGILLDCLGRYRLTLQMKCADLNAEQLARRSLAGLKSERSQTMTGTIDDLAADPHKAVSDAGQTDTWSRTPDQKVQYSGEIQQRALCAACQLFVQDRSTQR